MAMEWGASAGHLKFTLPVAIRPEDNFCLSCWLNLVTTGGTSMFNIVAPSATDKNNWIAADNTNNGYRRSNPFTFGQKVVSHGSSPVDRWFHLGADVRNGDSEFWVEGTKYTGVTSGVSAIGSNGSDPTVYIINGSAFSSVYSSFTNSRSAHAAVWANTSLTDDEFVSLSRGISPTRIRPQALTHYTPLVRNYHSIVKTGNVLAETGASPSAAPGPRIYGR